MKKESKKYFLCGLLCIILASCSSPERKPAQITIPDKSFGFIKGVTSSDVIVDHIEILRDEAAQKAYGEDFNGKEFDGIIYLRDLSDSLTTYPLTSQVRLIMATYSHNEAGEFNANEEISLQKFEKLFSDTTQARFLRTPFQFTAKENKLIEIKEIYVP